MSISWPNLSNGNCIIPPHLHNMSEDEPFLGTSRLTFAGLSSLTHWAWDTRISTHAFQPVNTLTRHTLYYSRKKMYSPPPPPPRQQSRPAHPRQQSRPAPPPSTIATSTPPPPPPPLPKSHSDLSSKLESPAFVLGYKTCLAQVTGVDVLVCYKEGWLSCPYWHGDAALVWSWHFNHLHDVKMSPAQMFAM